MKPERRHFPITVRKGDGLQVTGDQGRVASIVMGECRTFNSAEEIGEYMATSQLAEWFDWRHWCWRQGHVQLNQIVEVWSESKK
jgi:hypothetical protein